MKNHVPSLDLCKQLKEAGYPQERATYFRWLNFGDLIDGKDFRTLLSENFNSEDDTKEWYAAPLATELLEQLPREINDEEWGDCTLVIHPWIKNKWNVGYNAEEGEPFYDVDNASLPDALASMYLWLKKEKLL